MPRKKKRDSANKKVDIALKPVEISVEFPDKNSRQSGLKVNRLNTSSGKDVYSSVSWQRRDSLITDEKGKVISHIKEVEVPDSWSQLATDIIAYKYFRKAGVPSPEGRETSAKETIFRIARSFADFGNKFGYFSTKEDRDVFEDELTYLLLHQKAAFNSPVWFNVGLYHHYGIEGQSGSYYWDFAKEKVLPTKNAYRNPQCSACFILKVEDTLPAIFELLKTESQIFKYGSGSGANFSPLRSRFERLSGGGFSSGMMSFLRVFDRAAGATKSGGTTRRAAKMVVVSIDHPEIEDFIDWKVKEERKAAALIAAGYESDFNGEAYGTVSGQNSNNSVRVTDEFMKACEDDAEWQTRLVTTNEPYKTYKARHLLDKISEAAWQCADPGLQFDTTVNKWHTCPNTDRINASNPCSEYMFLDNSACNLASINLVKFVDEKGDFDVAGFRHACRIIFIAQEIAVDFSSYPTQEVAQNSHDYRPLGLGYANLGTLLMLRGIPYDSDQGRAIAGAITAVMCGHAYKTSAEMAAVKGPFAGFSKNRHPMLNVMQIHRQYAYRIDEKHCPKPLLEAARQDWDEALALGEQFGYRNSQATAIAPTGTIGLLMDCDTTGIEPDFALVKFKKLAGGGSVKIINSAVKKALANLGYTDTEVRNIISYALGSATLNVEAPINRKTLLERGLIESDLEALEKALPTAFELEHVFNPLILGAQTYSRLKADKEMEKPDFSLLRFLGFSSQEIAKSNEIICGAQTVEGAPALKEEHLAVFDCANRCGPKGKRFIQPMAHVKMMAAVQPFISGAISKTINLPNEATVDDVRDVYTSSWKLGLKALALYRDGSKLSQPLNTKSEAGNEDKTDKSETTIVQMPRRRRLPQERQALTHKFQIAGHEGYITVGMFPDGQPGEIFVTMAKQGSVISGLMDAFATSISIMLQYGVPVKDIVRKFINSRFEPYGFTAHPQIKLAKSIVDYIARYLGIKFLDSRGQAELGLISGQTESYASPAQLNLTPSAQDDSPEEDTNAPSSEDQPNPHTATAEVSSDAPPCPNCGSITFKTGSCYTCLSCGSTTGGC